MTATRHPEQSHEVPGLETGGRRIALLIFGWCNLVLGLIGVVVPVMPTTVFLILALWAFTRCSPRLRRWLYNHPRFGPSLRDWERYRIIPLRAKWLAAIMMAISLGIVTVMSSSWLPPVTVGIIMALALLYVVPARAIPLRSYVLMVSHLFHFHDRSKSGVLGT